MADEWWLVAPAVSGVAARCCLGRPPLLASTTLHTPHPQHATTSIRQSSHWPALTGRGRRTSYPPPTTRWGHPAPSLALHLKAMAVEPELRL